MIEIKVGHSYLLRSGAIAVCYFKVRNQDKYLMIVIGKTTTFYTRRYTANTGDEYIDICEDLGKIV